MAAKKKSVKKKVQKTANKSAKKVENKQEITQFKPGQSGNPNGRPKIGHALQDVLRNMMNSQEVNIQVEIMKPDGKKEFRNWNMKTNQDFNHVIAMALIQRGAKGDILAINTIFDRIHGKPGNVPRETDPQDDELKNLTLDEKLELLKEYTQKALQK